MEERVLYLETNFLVPCGYNFCFSVACFSKSTAIISVKRDNRLFLLEVQRVFFEVGTEHLNIHIHPAFSRSWPIEMGCVANVPKGPSSSIYIVELVCLRMWSVFPPT
jgi:hypothetical protein